MPGRTIKKTVVEEAQDSPGVVAYRVGQVEIVLKEGFSGLHDKIDRLADNFVPLQAFDEALNKAEEIHTDYEQRLRSQEKFMNRLEGAIKVLYAVATLLCVLIGALWWLKA